MATQMRLDASSLYGDLIPKLEAMGADVQNIIGRQMREAAHKIALDTKKALGAQFLPAKGRYSTGTTARSINYFPRVEWEGNVASVPVGFDFSLAGAGGYLISGTPRMQPDKELHKMYKQKKYMGTVHREMWEELYDIYTRMWA